MILGALVKLNRKRDEEAKVKNTFHSSSLRLLHSVCTTCAMNELHQGFSWEKANRKNRKQVYALFCAGWWSIQQIPLIESKSGFCFSLVFIFYRAYRVKEFSTILLTTRCFAPNSFFYGNRNFAQEAQRTRKLSRDNFTRLAIFTVNKLTLSTFSL